MATAVIKSKRPSLFFEADAAHHRNKNFSRMSDGEDFKIMHEIVQI